MKLSRPDFNKIRNDILDLDQPMFIRTFDNGTVEIHCTKEVKDKINLILMDVRLKSIK